MNLIVTLCIHVHKYTHREIYNYVLEYAGINMYIYADTQISSGSTVYQIILTQEWFLFIVYRQITLLYSSLEIQFLDKQRLSCLKILAIQLSVLFALHPTGVSRPVGIARLRTKFTESLPSPTAMNISLLLQ